MIRNRYNQIPHLTQDTGWQKESEKAQENITHKWVKSSALPQQVTTGLQETDITEGKDKYK